MLNKSLKIIGNLYLTLARLLSLNNYRKNNMLSDNNKSNYIWREGLCIICNNKLISEKYRDVCSNCVKLGFKSKSLLLSNKIKYNKIRKISEISGVIPLKPVFHSIYLGKAIPEHFLNYFLININYLNTTGILWVDDDIIGKIFHILLIKTRNQKINFEVKKISSLIHCFLHQENCSFLGITLRKQIIQMIYEERYGKYSKIAYAVDILRIIVLLLYGGLYLDINIKVMNKLKEKFDIKLDNACFGAKYMAIEQVNSSCLGWFPISGVENSQIYSILSCQINLKTGIVSSLWDDEKSKFLSTHKIKPYRFRPEVSSILGNKGALFFDIVLFDMLEKYLVRKKSFNYYLNDKFNKIDNNIKIKKLNERILNLSDNQLPNIINNRNPIIITSMILAQKLLMLKSGCYDEDYYYFTKSRITKTDENEINMEMKSFNYAGFDNFNFNGFNFIKYYSHSHKNNNYRSDFSLEI